MYTFVLPSNKQHSAFGFCTRRVGCDRSCLKNVMLTVVLLFQRVVFHIWASSYHNECFSFTVLTVIVPESAAETGEPVNEQVSHVIKRHQKGRLLTEVEINTTFYRKLFERRTCVKPVLGTPWSQKSILL